MTHPFDTGAAPVAAPPPDDQSGSRPALPLHHTTLLVLEAPEAARLLRSAGARVLEFCAQSVPEGAGEALCMDAVIAGTHLTRADALPAGRDTLLRVQQVVRERARASRDLAHRLGSVRGSGVSVRVDLDPLTPRHLLEEAARDGAWVVSVEHFDCSLHFELVDGAILLANGWVPGAEGARRVIGIDALRALLVLREGVATISPRLRGHGRPVLSLRDALDRVVQVELGVDDPGEQAPGATERPTIDMPAQTLCDLLGRFTDLPAPTHVEEEPVSATLAPPVRALRPIPLPKPPRVPGPPALPLTLQRKKKKA